MSGLKHTKTLDYTHKFYSLPHDLTETWKKKKNADYCCWPMLQCSIAFFCVGFTQASQEKKWQNLL